jgi:hypothetical protein
MESAAFRRSIDGCGDRGVVMAHIRWRNQSGHMLRHEVAPYRDICNDAHADPDCAMRHEVWTTSRVWRESAWLAVCTLYFVKSLCEKRHAVNAPAPVLRMLSAPRTSRFHQGQELCRNKIAGGGGDTGAAPGYVYVSVCSAWGALWE